MAPKTSSKWPKMCFEALPGWKTWFFKNIYKTQWILMIFTPEREPKRPKMLPKRLQETFFFHVDFWYRFWSALGSFWPHFWRHFGSQNRSKNRSKKWSKFWCEKELKKNQNINLSEQEREARYIAYYFWTVLTISCCFLFFLIAPISNIYHHFKIFLNLWNYYFLILLGRSLSPLGRS